MKTKTAAAVGALIGGLILANLATHKEYYWQGVREADGASLGMQRFSSESACHEYISVQVCTENYPAVQCFCDKNER